MASNKRKRLHELAQADVNSMCKRYEVECKDLGSHKATQKESAYYNYLLSNKKQKVLFNPLKPNKKKEED